jgi:hypothetical protein
MSYISCHPPSVLMNCKPCPWPISDIPLDQWNQLARSSSSNAPANRTWMEVGYSRFFHLCHHDRLRSTFYWLGQWHSLVTEINSFPWNQTPRTIRSFASNSTNSFFDLTGISYNSTPSKPMDTTTQSQIDRNRTITWLVKRFCLTKALQYWIADSSVKKASQNGQFLWKIFLKKSFI